MIAVRGKISENAVLQTLGYSRGAIAWLVIAEAVILSTVGGVVGVSSATVFLHMQSITIGNEGLAIAFIPSHSVWLAGFFLSWALGVVAGAYPAWQASSHSIVENLRAS